MSIIRRVRKNLSHRYAKTLSSITTQSRDRKDAKNKIDAKRRFFLCVFFISFAPLRVLCVPMDVKIEPSWKNILKDEFEKNYFYEIVTFLKTEKALGKTIYPPGSLIFHAFDATPFDNVKLVLLGQDPYHGYGQAHG